MKARLNLNSSNSSKPPSSDFKKKPSKSNRKSSGKPSGGQPGHLGCTRELVDISKVDKVVVCGVSEPCTKCGGTVLGIEDDPMRHQVYELPPIKLLLTEYRLQKGKCRNCGHNQMAELPSGITRGITGPRLTSFITMMVSDYKLSRREIKRWLKEHTNFELGLGTIFNKQRVVGEILKSQ